MDDDTPLFFYDFADPLSYLFDRALRRAEEHTGVRARRIPFESRPPPAPLTDPDDPVWADRWREAGRIAGENDTPLLRPAVVPWSRKAHELCLLAAAPDGDTADDGRAPPPPEADRDAVHAVFRAFYAEGRDIGRVDVLVEVGRALGLDLTATKAALDVDRHTLDVEAARDFARGVGVAAPAVLLGSGGRVEDFRNPSALGTLLTRNAARGD